MQPKNAYFPALDALRAIAILLVFVAHFGGVTALAGLHLDWPEWNGLGRAGLVLFFILSGFLITYLLLQEQARQKINVGNFYMRRILRIWPLYLLIITIGQFLIPFTGLLGLHGIDHAILTHFRRMTIYYLLFLPNLAFLLIQPVNPYLGHTWSIGVEEQFYLIWPWILQKYNKRLHLILWVLIGLTLLSSWCYEYWFPHLTGDTVHILSKFNAAFYWSNIGYFALGGLMAFYKLRRPNVAKILSDKIIQAVALILSCFLLVTGHQLLNGFVMAVFFSVVIFNATQPGTLIQRLQHPIMIYLGKISYGMYIFHVLAMMITAVLLVNTGTQHWQGLGLSLLAFFLAFGLTVVLAGLSYRFLESFFLRLKDRFGSTPPGARP